jgi:hypothetical protein
LQAAAYALVAGKAGRGRYLFARDDLEPERAEVAVRADEELARDFDAAVVTIARAWRAGAFVPRLTKPGNAEEGEACASCRVSDACLRGDTSARLRLAVWRDAGRDDAPPLVAARALLALGKAPR